MSKLIIKSLCSAAFMASVFSTSAHAADCVVEMDMLSKSAVQLEQEMIARDRDHVLVVEMADGTLADLRGEEPRSQPLESWFTGIEAGRKIYTDGYTKANQLASNGDIDGCLEQVLQLKSIIDDYTTRLKSN